MKLLLTNFLAFFLFILPLNAVNRSTIPWFKARDNIVKKYSKHVKKTYNMHLEGTGSNRDINDLFTCQYLSYAVAGHYDVDQARQLYLSCVDELLTLFNKSTVMQKYAVDNPFTIKNLDFCIRFTSKNGRPQYNHGLLFVSNNKDKIYYETCKSKNDPLITIHSELYEEAKNIVMSVQYTSSLN